jgi:hypothetical protein
MRANLWIVCGLNLSMLLAGCGRARPPQPSVGSSSQPHDRFAVGELSVGPPITHANMTVFPVLSTQPLDKDRFITLDDGLKSGTVEIREVGAQQSPNVDAEGGQHANTVAASGSRVNELLVVNKSDRPLYLMPGEIIVGGYQDRVIGSELVVAPSGEPTPIEVFCVEHGRWGQRDRDDTIAYLSSAAANDSRGASVAIRAPADAASADGALQTIAQQADEGKFVASVGSLSKKARLAVQAGEGQGMVWSEVAGQNARSGVLFETGTFTGNYVDERSLQQLEPYLKSLEQPIGSQSQVVGVVVAINGKTESLDVFESTPLFRKLWPKLLKSYALDAVSARQEPDATEATSGQPARACTQVEARDFLAEAMNGEGRRAKEGSIAVTTRSTERIDVFSASDGSSSMGGGFGGGGAFGGGIHVSGFGK